MHEIASKSNKNLGDTSCYEIVEERSEKDRQKNVKKVKHQLQLGLI